jgi:glucan phosphoethanolaminetransferase (alkaline phosphatase superfamily)
MLPPDESGAIFLAELAAFGLVRFWIRGRQASQEELGNRPKPPHDGVHLIFTGLGLVTGLVLLMIWLSHPTILPSFAGRSSTFLPLVAFVIFVYVVFVVGVSSSHHTSGDKSNAWLSSLSLLAATFLLLAAMVLPWFLLPHTQVPQQYQTWLALLIGLTAVVLWHVVETRWQHQKPKRPVLPSDNC